MRGNLVLTIYRESFAALLFVFQEKVEILEKKNNVMCDGTMTMTMTGPPPPPRCFLRPCSCRDSNSNKP